MGKMTHRWFPYKSTDLESVEAALADYARKGLKLVSIGSLFAEFEKVAPYEARYRLDPIQQRPVPMEPDADMLALYAESGWEYVDSWGDDYYIFTTSNASAPELHTDPALHAYALRRQLRSVVINLVLMTVALVGLVIWLLYALFQDGTPALNWLEAGTAGCLYVFIVLTLLTAGDIAQYVRFLRTLRAIRQGAASSGKDRHRSTALIQTASFLLSLTACFSWLVVRALGPEPVEYNFEDYTGTLPFLTLAEIEGEENFVYDVSEYRGLNFSNYITESSDLLAPRMLELKQYGQKREGRNRTYLLVQYYELKTEWMAERVLTDLMTQAEDVISEGPDTLSLSPGSEGYACVQILTDRSIFDSVGDIYNLDEETYQFLFLRSGCQVIKLCYRGEQDLQGLSAVILDVMLQRST